MNILDDLKVILADEFVANITTTKNAIELKFLNGETFKITVKKVSAIKNPLPVMQSA